MDTLRRKLVWLVVSRAAVLGVLFLITISIGRNSIYAWPVTFLVLVVSALSLIYAVALKANVPPKTLIPLQLVNDVLLVTWLVYRTGDVESPFTALYLVIIFAASLLSSRGGILAITLFAVLLFSSLSLTILTGVVPRSAEFAAYLHESLQSVQYNFSFTVVAILAVSILSTSLADRQLRADIDLEAATLRLQNLRAFNERVIESMRSGLVTADLDGMVATFNRAAEEITGHAASDVIGQPVSSLFGDIISTVLAHRETDGTRPFRSDVVLARPGGGQVHLGYNAAPLTSADGTTTGIVIIFQDLTEVFELEQEVRRQEKLAALGAMAAGLAHEIRNPLASMRGSIQVLAGELALDDDQQRLMEIVLRESERLHRTVSDFLSYARNAPLTPQEFDVRQAIADSVTLLRNSPELRPGHQIAEVLPEHEVRFVGDTNRIRQVFWNLARNALQAMPDGGRLTVRLEQAPSGSVWITIGDQGAGMTPAQVDRLFEPFTPSSTGGLGLGMAIVHRLVSDHGGRVTVESAPGAGTTVQVWLPALRLMAAEPGEKVHDAQTANR